MDASKWSSGSVSDSASMVSARSCDRPMRVATALARSTNSGAMSVASTSPEVPTSWATATDCPPSPAAMSTTRCLLATSA
jgi:hypothetical protein